MVHSWWRHGRIAAERIRGRRGGGGDKISPDPLAVLAPWWPPRGPDARANGRRRVASGRGADVGRGGTTRARVLAYCRAACAAAGSGRGRVGVFRGSRPLCEFCPCRAKFPEPLAKDEDGRNPILTSPLPKLKKLPGRSVLYFVANLVRGHDRITSRSTNKFSVSPEALTAEKGCQRMRM